eukprot:362183-Chlamydomonas_euryale.AAC.8
MHRHLQHQIASLISSEEGVEPALVAMVWQKLEDLHPAFFAEYHARSKLKEQVRLGGRQGLGCGVGGDVVAEAGRPAPSVLFHTSGGSYPMAKLVTWMPRLGSTPCPPAPASLQRSIPLTPPHLNRHQRRPEPNGKVGHADAHAES